MAIQAEGDSAFMVSMASRGAAVRGFGADCEQEVNEEKADERRGTRRVYRMDDDCHRTGRRVLRHGGTYEECFEASTIPTVCCPERNVRGAA